MLPYPVTDYSSVYTAMCNFPEILSQLDQKYLAVFCYQGVYRIARHIQLLEPEKFRNLFFMLGSFHTTKISLACIGRYLEESGVDHLFIETESFGVNVVQEVLKGTHYARSIKGIFMLGETLERLLLESFFKENDYRMYELELTLISLLQDSFAEKDYSNSKSLSKEFISKCQKLTTDLEEFIEKRKKKSTSFHYWINVLILIQLLRDVVRADRSGDWILHVKSFGNFLPILYIFDRTNYIRWGSIYYQDILQLEKRKPELFAKFMEGKFVVKRSTASYTSVAGDQALEQTMNRSQKGNSGVIGCTKKKGFVSA